MDRLLALAHGAVHCMGRAAALAHVALGQAYPLTKSSSFAAFLAGLPYPVVSATAQGATQLFACKLKALHRHGCHAMVEIKQARLYLQT